MNDATLIVQGFNILTKHEDKSWASDCTGPNLFDGRVIDELQPEVFAAINEFLAQDLIRGLQVARVLFVFLTQRIAHDDKLAIRERLDDLITGPTDGTRLAFGDLRQLVLQILVFSDHVPLLVLNLHLVITDEPHEAGHQLREQMLLVGLVLHGVSATWRPIGLHQPSRLIRGLDLDEA